MTARGQQNYRCQGCGTVFAAQDKVSRLTCPDCRSYDVRHVPRIQLNSWPVGVAFGAIALLAVELLLPSLRDIARPLNRDSFPATLLLSVLWLLVSIFGLKQSVGPPLPALVSAVVIFVFAQALDVFAYSIRESVPFAMLLIYLATPLLTVGLVYQHFEHSVFEALMSVAAALILCLAIASLPNCEVIREGVAWRVPFWQ